MTNSFFGRRQDLQLEFEMLLGMIVEMDVVSNEDDFVDGE